MAVNILRSALRKITISKQGYINPELLYMQPVKIQQNTAPSLSQNTTRLSSNTNNHADIKFTPRSLFIDFGLPMNNGLRRSIIELPIPNISSIEEPLIWNPVHQDIPISDKSFELPPMADIVEKQAINMVRIKRRKMKIHKRKKLRKKMRKIWETLRSRRNIRREKDFQAELIAQIQQAQQFNAEEYVAERLKLYEREILPKTYRGEILPPEMIKEFIEKSKACKLAKRNKPRLKL